MKYVVQPHEHIIPNVSAITLHYLIVFGHGQYLSISTSFFYVQCIYNAKSRMSFFAQMVNTTQSLILPAT